MAAWGIPSHCEMLCCFCCCINFYNILLNWIMIYLKIISAESLGKFTRSIKYFVCVVNKRKKQNKNGLKQSLWLFARFEQLWHWHFPEHCRLLTKIRGWAQMDSFHFYLPLKRANILLFAVHSWTVAYCKTLRYKGAYFSYISFYLNCSFQKMLINSLVMLRNE